MAKVNNALKKLNENCGIWREQTFGALVKFGLGEIDRDDLTEL